MRTNPAEKAIIWLNFDLYRVYPDDETFFGEDIGIYTDKTSDNREGKQSPS